MSVFFVQEAELKHREGLYLSRMLVVSVYDNQLEEFKIRGNKPVFQLTLLLSPDRALSVFCNVM